MGGTSSTIDLRDRLSSASTAVSRNSLIVTALIRLSNGLVGEVVNFRKKGFIVERYIYWSCQFPFHERIIQVNVAIDMIHNNIPVIILNMVIKLLFDWYE